MSWFSMRDGQGRESKTLVFVTLAVLVITAKFVAAGISIAGFAVPAMTATEYTTSFMGVLAAWLGREWIKQ